MKVVIIGGVAGGATAAARIRRLDEQAEIVMLERSGYISYANCGLPYYVGGVIADAGELTLQTPESFRRRFHIDVRVRHEALSVNRAAHTVAVRNLETGETYAESYDRLLLAPGAEPIRPALPGIDLPGVFTLRTVEDTLRISHALEEQRLRSAVIVGGGFIGVEMAENLHRRGLAVTILEKQPQLLGQLDADMACFVHAHLREKGISLALGQGLAGIEAADGGRLTVRTEAGAALPADAVLLALGVRPESRLAAEAGLRSLFIGFESLNQESLSSCGKGINRVAEYRRLIRRLQDRGIMINASFVFGLDADRKDVFDRTVDWAVSSGIETATFHLATPYPGTPFFRRMEAGNRLLHRDWDRYDTRHAVIRHPHMSAEELESGYRRAYRNFYQWSSIFRSASRHPSLTASVRHFAYASAWKKMDPFWTLLIHLRRLPSAVPLLERALALGSSGGIVPGSRKGKSESKLMPPLVRENMENPEEIP